MKKINKKVLKVVERVIRNEIKRASGDPPFCLGIFPVSYTHLTLPTNSRV